MKVKKSLLVASTALFASQTHAAVDVTGFSIGGGSFPFGLVAMILILAGFGYTRLRRES